MSVTGFLVDVGIGAVTSKLIPGMKGAALGGFVGGAASAAVDGKGPGMDMLTDGVLGLVGGAATHGINSRVISKGLGEAAGKSSKALASAGGPEARYAAAITGLKDAKRAEVAARNAYNGLSRVRRAMPNSRQALDDAERALDQARGVAKQARSSARLGADELAKAKSRDKWLQRANNQFGNGTSFLKHNWGRAGLIGLGAAAVPALYNLNKDDPGAIGGVGGQQPPPQKQQTPLVWDGEEPAIAAGVMWEEPFVMDAELQALTNAGETGFLLRAATPDPKPAWVEWYGGPTNSFASSLVDNYQLYGDPELKLPLELTPVPLMEVSAAVQGSAGGHSYDTLVKSLNAKAIRMTEVQEGVPAAKEKVEVTQERGRKNIASLIKGVNRVMVGIPDNSPTEFVKVLLQAMSELTESVGNDAAANELAAKKLAESTEAADKKASENLKDSVNRLEGRQQDPGYNPNSSQIGANNPFNPGNIPGYNDPPTSQDLTDSADRFKQQAEDLQKQADKALGIGSTPSLTNPAAYNPGSSQLGSPGSLGGMSGMGGMGGMGGLFDMLMQQQMMRGLQDTDMARRSPDLDPSRYDRAGAPTMAPQAAPASTTPWSNQAAPANNTAAAAAQPASHQTGAPNGATSTQPGAPVPKRVPGEDGLVPYSFPDGRTQRVPVAVAQALDKAFADKEGTDAKAAYQGTPGAWADSKDIGPGVDPFQLATGDVGTWIIRQPKSDSQQPALVPASATDQPAAIVTVDGRPGDKEEPPKEKPDTGSGDEPQYRTALLVAFGNGESGTLEVLVAGELREYAPEMSDNDGDFGEFAGFKHPKGVEAVDKNQDPDAMQTSGDQNTVDMPALTAPV